MNNGLPPLPDDASEHLPEEARKWLEAHPDLSVEDMELAWAWAGQAEQSTIQIDSSRVEKMQKDLPSGSSSVSITPANHRRRFLSMAASFLILCGIGFAFFYPFDTVHKSTFGETISIDLPDGSEVLLNAGSELRYAEFTDAERRVVLAGEAFFDVVESKVPFVVETFNSETTVLGTSFNVRAWKDDLSPETMVVLESGSVRLSSENSVLLSPGQISRVISGFATEPSSIRLDQWLNWKQGGMAFEDQKVGDVLNELERRFGASFEARSAIRNEPISIFQNSVKSPDTVLESVCGAMSCRFTKTEEGYQIR